METFLQDLRYGLRMLLKSPGFTAVAIIALALGIGANSAIFSVVNAVLLRPLPFSEPDRLAWVTERMPRGGFRGVPAPDLLEWQDQNHVFEDVTGYSGDNWNMTGGAAEPERVPGAKIGANMFSTLGVQPFLGRAFTREEDLPGGEPVAILMRSLWQRHFASDPDVIGKTLTLNDKIYTVVGVMPANFRLPDSADVLIPLALDAHEQRTSDRSLLVRVIARLKPGITLEQASIELQDIVGRLDEQHLPARPTGLQVEISDLHERIVGDVRPALLVLLGAVGFVLLIACANVANLLLARAAARQKEIAIRAALGASRARLIRQLLTESVMLALVGGCLGILLALWGVDILIASLPQDLAAVAQSVGRIGVDGGVFGFTFAVSIITGILFGLAPALVASKPSLNNSLKEGTKSSKAGFSLSSLRGVLVVAELALALVLLVGAGLMIKSFLKLQSVNPGFRPERVLTMQMNLSMPKYEEQRKQSEFFRQVLERVEHLQGVESASVTSTIPLTGSSMMMMFSMSVEGRPEPVRGQEPPVLGNAVSRDFFNTMRIPLLQGRFFTDQDTEASEKVVIVNESFARRYWPDEDAVGKRVMGSAREGRRTIVGVVGDVHGTGLSEEVKPEVFMPYLQSSTSRLSIAVRTEADPLSMVAAVRSQVQAVDQDQPVANVMTMNQHLAQSVSEPRFNMLLLGVFAALALVLAGVGIYGVMSYTVAQRTHEIGIRMALGAQANDVVRLIVRQAMAMTVAGVVIGLFAAFALTRVMESLLFGVSATDPATFALISLVLTGVALGACFIPARRAARVDPLVALRYE
ncbi:MAG: ABC transporter permease [Blastocatellia bacterium]